MPTIHKNTDGPGTSSGTTPRAYELRLCSCDNYEQPRWPAVVQQHGASQGPWVNMGILIRWSPRPRRPHDDHKYIHTTYTPAPAPPPIQRDIQRRDMGTVALCSRMMGLHGMTKELA